jgi:glutathione S-transferase
MAALRLLDGAEPRRIPQFFWRKMARGRAPTTTNRSRRWPNAAARINRLFAHLDRRLAATPFVAKDRYTIADITAFITVEFAKWAKLPVPPSCPQLGWLANQSARASAKA